MFELNAQQIEVIAGGSLATDAGKAVGGAIATAVDSVQTFCSDVSDLFSSGLTIYAGATV